MVPRDTRTGTVLEQMVLPALKCGGYEYETQVHIGNRFGGGRHVIDVLVKEKSGRQHLISLKWQQVSGTAEQKVPYEAMCLAETVLMSGGKYNSAYLVLGGEGWKLRDFFTEGGLNRHLRYGELIKIVKLEKFIALANQGKL